jgi:hypothetical protein
MSASSKPLSGKKMGSFDQQFFQKDRKISAMGRSIEHILYQFNIFKYIYKFKNIISP